MKWLHECFKLSYSGGTLLVGVDVGVGGHSSTGGGMIRPHVPDVDVTVVMRVFDDEERIGHVLRRVTQHLRGLGLSFELLLVDEGSGDNTLAVVALVRSSIPELEVLHTVPQQGYVTGSQAARGRA